MPRQARLTAPNLFYHIFNRGTNQKSIFKTQSDYLRFLENLKKYKKKFDWLIYSYCLLPTHYHLQIQARKYPLGKILLSLQTAYSVYFNKKYQTNGPLFQGRYKSIIVQNGDYFLHLSKYIHLNPVKLNLTKNPLNYPFSSYGEYCQEPKHPYQLIDKRASEKIIGKSTKQNIRKYRQFVEETENLIYTPNEATRGIVGSLRYINYLESKFRNSDTL
ncbi:hypothetical protein COU96_01785 [Candidatus Shapirobacteria bacterium CG10_big_fil_rev_8_21_14_0_10_38_14]|uniref:Transposase IS200-like domain-containing protein n=1 Tax=Candidatus Shapirobacteria bacterium CG10_big_fil_rev_8_21_14_0_10_38_14 TaxID=1974483 RepID=A0A2M8L5G2_9BACT|nr:MAG: hypothetical protein COU96_01785 [Candidatus Shapirobacteria bacterium CG10_big_fil_rev_8_21_14_0_10_38_14]